MSTIVSPRAATLSTSQTTVTGLISDPGGNPATGGTVTFVLSPSSSAIAFRVAGTSIFAPRTVVCQISPTGQLLNEAGTGPCLIWGNPAILPGNTTYTLLISPTVNGSPLTTSTIYGVLIFGATYDLSNIQFAPNVEVTPQQTVLRADPVEANLVPITGHVFNLGSQQLPYANIFADDLTLSSGSTVSSDNIQAKNIAADNITTSNLAATQIAASSANITSLTAPTLNSTNATITNLTTTSFSPTNLTVTNLTATNLSATVLSRLNVSAGVSQGSGLKHARFNSGVTAATIGATVSTTFTWPSAFPDSNYTVVAAVVPVTGQPQVLNLNFTATQVTVVIQATTAVASQGEILIIAMHD